MNTALKSLPGSSFASHAGIRVTRDGADNASAMSLWTGSGGTLYKFSGSLLSGSYESDIGDGDQIILQYKFSQWIKSFSIIIYCI